MDILLIVGFNVFMGWITALIARARGGARFYDWWFFATLLWIIALPYALLMPRWRAVVPERDGEAPPRE